mmetsp:Transcript_22725/g.53022  ORF Transcript_22725/g.53022 Transcript_22725/m.53022 type:complete len:110 (+) Transcript_22725:77-406(+)
MQSTFQKRVEAVSRTSKMQRFPFQYASQQEIRSFTEKLIDTQQMQVFKAHGALRKLKAAAEEQVGDERQVTQKQISDTVALQNLCDAHFTRLQRAKKRGFSPGRCLLFS